MLLFHLPQLSKNQGLPYFSDLPIFNRGIDAVYMFFVLSGFLIIRLIYQKKIKEQFSIRKFYMRRILRIFPLYYLIVAFGFIFYKVLLPFLEIPFQSDYNLIEGILLCVFFLPNIFGKLYEPGGVLEILWSIGIEEQFYLFIAPLMMLIKPKRVFLTLTFLTFGYFFLFHAEYLKVLREYQFVYFFIFSGGIIAIMEEKKYLDFLKKYKGIPLTILVLTILYFTTNLILFETLWIQNLVTSLLFSLFIHTLAHNNHGIAIKNKLLNYLGTISYGLYMFHVIALNLVVYVFLKLELGNNLSESIVVLLINIMTFVITIFMAHISYKYYESYFLKQKKHFR